MTASNTLPNDKSVEWWAKSAIHINYCAKGSKNCEWCIKIGREVGKLGIHEDNPEMANAD